MRNTLFDSELGDVTSINMPIGQSTPYSGAFTSVSVTSLAAASVSVSGTVAAGAVAGSVGAFSGTVSVGGLGLVSARDPSINLTTATSAFVAAYGITAAINIIVSASFTSGSPVALPSVATWLGGEITIFNQSTHTVAVWPQTADIIDTTATGAFVLLDAGKRSNYYAVSTTGIISAQLGVTSV